MSETRLLHIHTYTDTDHAFWRRHLADWVPSRVCDAHVHIVDPRYQIETVSEELKRSYWVMELSDMQDAATAEHCYRTLFPERQTSCLCFAYPTLGWEIEGANLYVSREAATRGWHALIMPRPTWVAEQLAWWLDQPAVIGVKPYYALIGYDRTQRDTYIEASIFDFLPHHQWDVLNDRRAWVTLHVPKADRLGHPENQREIRLIRERYPHVTLVIAHLGRSYTLSHAVEGLLLLADDPGIRFDLSAVMNPDVLELALRHLGPERLLYGTDNPVFYMRGRQRWEGTRYINHTSCPFAFNTHREAPEIEATYTIYTYEALKALKDACERVEIDRAGIEAIFSGNAQRFISRCNTHTRGVSC